MKDNAQFSFKIRRHAHSHLSNGFLLVTIITLLNFTAFGVDPDDSQRLGITVTVALTLVSLRRQVVGTEAGSMPTTRKSSNWLDLYLQVGVGWTLVISCVISLYRPHRFLGAHDWQVFWALLGFYSASVIAFATVCYFRWKALGTDKLPINDGPGDDTKTEHSDGTQDNDDSANSPWVTMRFPSLRRTSTTIRENGKA